MAKTLFEAIGYALGQKAAQAKNAFDLVGGTEEDSLRAGVTGISGASYKSR